MTWPRSLSALGNAVMFLLLVCSWLLLTRPHNIVVWRILIGLSLIPAFGTLYQRLTLPESTRFTEARKNARIQDEESVEELKKKANADPGVNEKDVCERVQPVNSDSSSTDSPAETGANAPANAQAEELAEGKKTHFKEFFAYFSEWRHAKILLGTCSCWFLLDIAYVLPRPISYTPNSHLTGWTGSTAST